MLVGEMTPEALTVKVNPQVHIALPEVRPIKMNRREWDGERAAGGSHPEHSSGLKSVAGESEGPGWLRCEIRARGAGSGARVAGASRDD